MEININELKISALMGTNPNQPRENGLQAQAKSGKFIITATKKTTPIKHIVEVENNLITLKKANPKEKIATFDTETKEFNLTTDKHSLTLKEFQNIINATVNKVVSKELKILKLKE